MDIPDLGQITAGLGAITKGAQAVDAAINTIKHLREMGKKPGNAGKTDELLQEVLGQLTDAQLANLDLKKQLIALETELLELRKQANLLSNYDLVEMPTGSLVLRLRANTGTGGPVHYACPNCADHGRRSILQGDQYMKSCPACKTSFPIQNYEPPVWTPDSFEL